MRTFGARRISSWYAALCMHQCHTRMISMIWRDLFKFGIFTLMLSIRVRNWCVCPGYASVPDAFAQGMHKFLMHMLSERIISWCVCSACFEGTVLLKIRLSIRVRNFAAPNEPLNMLLKKILFSPQSRPFVETLWCKNHENPSDWKSHTWHL